ncbi:deoxyribodipyrimidine photo-lyase [Halothiobacillus sp.]|uniref:cryptochrome/photolyase family protein n=1 Tax=Halothiobacillus sp. TaxID=1891311 RepID=UPI002605FC52|nr:deoxyribodipyrimidine photo-lyase [Halothiobacillus sp.]
MARKDGVCAESALSVVWFRDDLRLTDHPALHAALKQGAAILIYIASDRQIDAEGAAARWWRHRSLEALSQSICALGGRLIVRRGEALDVLRALITETNAGTVMWNRRLQPAAMAEDTRIKAALRAEGVVVKSFPGNVLHEAWQIMTQQAKPYKVFTPYWKAIVAAGLDMDVLPAPTHLTKVNDDIPSLSIRELGYQPRIPWDKGFVWTPGELGAQRCLTQFMPKMAAYSDARDMLAGEGVSKLSPHLHFGEISPRQALAAITQYYGCVLAPSGVASYVRELGWREFAQYLLYHFPYTVTQALDTRFEAFPWRHAPDDLRAWQRGQTGIPVVDAAMRCLWQTGWMHNRARMIVASFLTKNLLIDWRHGAAWFMDTLVDADLGSNTAGWQWTAGSGADAAPYFRIFNPVLQAEKYDSDGVFIRTWLPELARLNGKDLFAPWLANPNALRAADVRLGENYPYPIVDLASSRTRALNALESMKSINQE